MFFIIKFGYRIFSYFCIMVDVNNLNELKALLNHCFTQYNHIAFIENDPILIPHSYSKKEDIEISAFFASLIAWGNRASIIKSGKKLMSLMEDAPADFVRNHSPHDLKRFEGFVHRTLNVADVHFFMAALQQLYLDKGGLEAAFSIPGGAGNAYDAIDRFRQQLFSFPHELRTEKHIGNPSKNSACKRLNMYLRWMVRSDEQGVDFGIWKSMLPAQLICPLDVHTARTARKLNLLTRQQNDRKAAEELTRNLSYFCPLDPVKYDFALFGAGVNGLL